VTLFRINDDVLKNFPGAMVALIAASGLRQEEPWPAAEEALSSLERRCAAGEWQPPAEDDERIAAWHKAYRLFGVNPRRMRPSVDALCRRLARGGQLPRISSAVDAYNTVSVTHVFPAGAFDVSQLTGAVDIRYARDGDEFTPLGEPEVTETPLADEVVYVDEKSVLTRCWNHRDCDRTKVLPASQDVVFILETLDAQRYSAALAEAVEQLSGFISPHAAAVGTAFLHAGAPSVQV
jgi:DNA/RNA-binding domain of Phe-tRNA-synthetase-like protein